MLECEKKARPKNKRNSLYDSVLDFFGHFVLRKKKTSGGMQAVREATMPHWPQFAGCELGSHGAWLPFWPPAFLQSFFF